MKILFLAMKEISMQDESELERQNGHWKSSNKKNDLERLCCAIGQDELIR